MTTPRPRHARGRGVRVYADGVPVSSRQPVYARNVIATSQPLATSAGLAVFERGGNAVDAAVAAAVCLTVVEPTSNGIGGDLFAIVDDGQAIHGLSANGRSPAAWTAERFAGLDAMPLDGPDSVTVPGCVAGWRDLHQKFGRLPFADLFAPAIRHARDGHPVSPITAEAWGRSEARFGRFDEFRRVFLPAPKAGELWRSEGHARTLERIAADDGEDFYRGELASKIADAVRELGGVMTADDLASHANVWHAADELVSGNGCGVRLHEIPPSGQGLAASLALQIAQSAATRLGVDRWDTPDGTHVQIEAMKLALADLYAHVADPAHMTFAPADLLSPAYADGRASLIMMDESGDFGPGDPTRGGTVCLAAADSEGLMVSLIQSNYHGFGSGLVVPGTGIALQNRAHGFVTTPGHPNQVDGGKRPLHTIIPGFVTTPDGSPLMAFGLMGGPMQAQGHLQMVLRVFGDGQDIQETVDAPRWQHVSGRVVAVEEGFPPFLLDDLERRGHDVRPQSFHAFGGAQLVHRLENGTYAAASDPRKDGHAAGL